MLPDGWGEANKSFPVSLSSNDFILDHHNAFGKRSYGCAVISEPWQNSKERGQDSVFQVATEDSHLPDWTPGSVYETWRERASALFGCCVPDIYVIYPSGILWIHWALLCLCSFLRAVGTPNTPQEVCLSKGKDFLGSHEAARLRWLYFLSKSMKTLPVRQELPPPWLDDIRALQHECGTGKPLSSKLRRPLIFFNYRWQAPFLF